jgi:8-oxo-dGTP pyrophosphatase MutT (NUDIX family)
VLVPLVGAPDAPDPQVLLTRRTAHLSDHAGQIAFPGGRIEAWDASAESAALREAEEEVGLDPRRVEIVGQLDTYLTRTGYRVTPVVGVLDAPGELRPDAYEVDEVFQVPLAFFLDPASRQVHSRGQPGRERFFYAFPYRGYYIWGATAGMLVNLVELLCDPAP